MIHLPTTKQLQYLIALADYRSFSKAANACNVTQSTLSAGIAALEELLGQKIVDRGARDVVLTPLGQDILSKADKIIHTAEHILHQARRMSTPLTGKLRIGMIPTIAPYILPDILPGILETYPDLQLELQEDLTQTLLDRVKKGHLDMIIMAFPYNTKGFNAQILFEEYFYLAAPKGKWADKRRDSRMTVDIEELKDHNILLLDDGHCLRDHALAACHMQAPSDRSTFRATSLATLIQMVQHGFGITLLPEMVAMQRGVRDYIDLFPLGRAGGEDVATRKIGVAWRENHAREQEFRMLTGTITYILKNPL